MKTSFVFRSSIPFVVASLALGFLVPATNAQDVSLAAALKEQVFFQDNPSVPSLASDHQGRSPFVFNMFLSPASAGSVTSASFTGPGAIANGTLTEDNGEFHYEAKTDDKPEFDANFPDTGNYVLSYVGTTDGSASFTVNFSGISQPNVPVIVNWQDARSVDASADFTVEWEPFSNGTGVDFINVIVDDAMGSFSFESPGPGEPGGLNGTSTTFTIAANTLEPGRRYEATVGFYKFGAPDNQAVPVLGKSTVFEIYTDQVNDQYPPYLAFSSPYTGARNVTDRSAVLFEFTERMNWNVDFSQAIHWDGVNGANFSYTWQREGSRLLCVYDGDLPLGATIGWTLNPELAGPANAANEGASPASKQGVAQSNRLEDLAGNDLAGPYSGEFTTLATATTGQKDIIGFELYKWRAFFQDGASAVDTGIMGGDVEVELNGYNTLTSVHLTVPGAPAPIELPVEGYSDGVSVEAEYASKTDLDSFLPNGAYTLKFNTLNDLPTTVTLDAAPENYPNAPEVQNHSAAQAIDPAQNFTLTWNAMSPQGANDFILIFIENDYGNEIVDTPTRVFDGDLLTAPIPAGSTSLVIPAGTLPPGRQLSLELIFVHVTDLDTAGYPGVKGSAGFATLTSLDIATTGDPIVPELDMVGVADGNRFQLRVNGEYKVPYTIESTVDFRNWVFAFSSSAEDRLGNAMGGATFADPNSPLADFKFYRAREGWYFPDNGGGATQEIWNLVFYPAMVVDQSNGGSSLSFVSQSLSVDQFGNFNETWSPGNSIVNVSGNLSGGNVSASLNAVNSMASGSFNGSMSGNMIIGSYNYENSGSVVIVQQPNKISVQGRVVDNGSGLPLSGATVTTTIGGSATTDSNGFFFLVTDEPEKNGVGEPFPYCIDVRKPDTHADAQDAGCQPWGDHLTGRTFSLAPLTD